MKARGGAEGAASGQMRCAGAVVRSLADTSSASEIRGCVRESSSVLLLASPFTPLPNLRMLPGLARQKELAQRLGTAKSFQTIGEDEPIQISGNN